MTPARKHRESRVGVPAAVARQLALALPGVVSGRSYGVPSLKIGDKFLARLRDGDTVMAVHIASFEDRDYLIAKAPGTFFTTEHYRDYPIVLVRLAHVDEDDLRQILGDACSRLTKAVGRSPRKAATRRRRK